MLLFFSYLFAYCRIDDSPGSPVRQPAQAISKIANRNQKLKAFRLQRNTQKLKEIQEKRSPFIVTVPSGRWVEKKERAPQFRFGLSDTPVRNVLMNERVLKKSTVKKLIAESALKKENVMDFHGKEAPKHAAVKSKKKILGELNAVQTIQVYEESESEVMLERIDSDLNSTFDISPDQNEKKDTGTKRNLKKNLKRRSSMSSIASITNVVKPKMLTPPAKPVTKKYHIPAIPVCKAVIAKPVVVRKAIVVPVKASLPVSAFANGRTHLKRSAKKPANKLDSKSSKARSKDEVVEVEQENIREPVIEAKAGLRPAKQKQPARSATYNLYKSSLDIQIAYLNMKITEIMSKNNEMFLDVLSEDQQTFVHQTVQQANLLISDKLGKFQEFLDIFETGQSNDPKKVTEDDVENYFLLIYEEIEKIKNDLSKTSAMQKEALTVVASQKKRRTRKTYLQEEGTPRRSIRIAEHSNTPK